MKPLNKDTIKISFQAPQYLQKAILFSFDSLEIKPFEAEQA